MRRFALQSFRLDLFFCQNILLSRYATRVTSLHTCGCVLSTHGLTLSYTCGRSCAEYRYSPYDNVKAQAYPNLVITAGLHDPRVAYWEPAKWACKLRYERQGKLQLLPPAPPYHPFPRGKYHTRVIYGVLLWADMNTATPLGARGRSVISLANAAPASI